MTRPRRRLAKLLLGVVVAVALLSVVELALRLAGTFASSTTSLASANNFRDMLIDLGAFDDADRFVESDAELLWKLRPGVHDLPWHPKLWLDCRSNALGYRDPERSYAARDGTLRLFCLGDSCTYGVGVRLADSYPQQLEALLALGFTDRVVEVWNGGVPGWTSDQGLTLFERDGARIHPSIVTVAFGINDGHHWDFEHHKERGHALCRTDRETRAALATPLARIDRTLGSLALYRWIAKALRSSAHAGSAPSATTAGEPTANAGNGSVRVPIAEFRENLRAIAAASRALGATPVFLVWPIRWQIEKPPDRDLDPPTAYQIATREEGASLHVPTLDLLDRFAGRSELYVDSVHMTAKGCRQVATELGQFLFEQKLLPELPSAPSSSH